MRLSREERRELVTGFLECLLWSSTGPDDRMDVDEYGDREPMPLDDFGGLAPGETRRIGLAVARWAEGFAPMLERAADFVGGWEIVGHDLCLTSGGHGMGFWDRECLEVPALGQGPTTLGDFLTEASRSLGVEHWCGWVDMDGLVRFDGVGIA